MIEFTKIQGLGNDYLYINCINPKNNIPKVGIEKLARYMCNRNFGVGADGIILLKESNTADFKMEIYNSDGSRAQMCGNGIRGLGKYIFENGILKKDNLRIETDVGIKNIRLYIKNNKVDYAMVNMGVPILEKELIPVICEENEFNDKGIITKKFNIENKEYIGYCISMGNPHCVIYQKNLEIIDIEKVGSIIENSNCFPEKSNVEFIQILDRKTIKMRVWERGAGKTLACGTGACAVMTVSNILGFTGRDVKVMLDGGELYIKQDEKSKNIYMTGIITKVFDGIIEIGNL
jgi:diaminopimelate epimerase